jgi:O-glycosyl hydrolase
MNRNKFLAGLSVLLLALSFVFIGCEDLGGEGERPPEVIGDVYHPRPAAPFITQQPKDFTYFVSDTIQPLTVAVEVKVWKPEDDPQDGLSYHPTDGGILSFQWYSNTRLAVEGGTPLDGETDLTYTPTLSTTSVTATPAYYYVVITNTNTDFEPGYQTNSLPSKVVQLSVKAAYTGSSANATITVSPITGTKAHEGSKAQYVRGFGGMDVVWDNFPDVSLADMDNMFNPDKLGYNMLRIMIMPWHVDIDQTMYELVNNIAYPDKERRYYYDFVRMVNNYGGYVLASPWSPPAEWKTNESTIGGGKLITTYYRDYARYLAKFAQHMYDKGAPIYVISIQNEPNYVDTGYDGCTWTESDSATFFRQQGQFTRNIKGYGGGKEIPRVLAMNGESANNPDFNDAAMEEDAARRYIDLLARHNYGSRGLRYTKGINLGYEVWMTEHNINSNSDALFPNDSTWNYIWQFMNDVDLTIRLNDESAFIWWSLKRFYSFVGDGRFATLDGDVLPRGHGLSHYAKFASEMYRTALTVTGTTGSGTAITVGSNFNIIGENIDKITPSATAFVSGDGNTISLVMYTPTTTSGANGTNMGTIKIQLPAGFEANSATAMRSKNGAMSVWEDVPLSADRNSAYVTLPAGEILSVKFSK